MEQASPKLRCHKDLWVENVASSVSESEKLRYRSNSMDAALRISNLGGNASSKIKQQDPVGLREVGVLWMKDGIRDLGNIIRTSFATFYTVDLFAMEGGLRAFER